MSGVPLLEIGGARREARGGQRRVTGERGRTRRVRQAHRAAERRERTRRATHVRAQRGARTGHTHTHTYTQAEGLPEALVVEVGLPLDEQLGDGGLVAELPPG